MRISDWSSDVCSSDLAQCDILGEAVDLRGGALGEEDVAQGLRLRSGNELREQRAFLLLSLVDRQFGRGLPRLNAGLVCLAPSDLTSILRGDRMEDRCIDRAAVVPCSPKGLERGPERNGPPRATEAKRGVG